MAGSGLVLALLLLPLALAGGNAWATKQNLEQALSSLADGDIAAAGEKTANAQEDARDMHGATEGLYGFLWGLLPGGDEARSDVRLLSGAALDVTGVVDIAVDAYPRDRVGDGFILDDSGRIDVVALEAELHQFDAVQARIVAAADLVDRVQGSAPLIGPLLSRTADSVGGRLDSVIVGLDLVQPLAPVLPQLLGADEEQKILLVLLNPAEQRLSGGAALSFLPIFLEEGRLREGQSVIEEADRSDAFGLLRWKRVAGNPFHPPGQFLRLSKASLAPSWSTSGLEMIRAWKAGQGGESLDGLVAVDVIALQKLMRFTGPIDVPGLGTLNENNLTKELIGSYDDYTGPDVVGARRSGTATLATEFLKRLTSSSNPLGILQSLDSSAQGRHLAVYYRDPEIQAAMRDAELEGDLSDTEYDYLGVFNQALTGLKSDYWQRRTINQDVTLHKDGSARVVLTVNVFNDSPPPSKGVDPTYSRYVRRDNDVGLAMFLPTSVRNLTVSRDGATLPPLTEQRSFRGRPFVTVELKLKPQETRTVTLTYDVQRAAEVRGKAMEYRLDVDPHGLVNPQQYAVSVTWPKGYLPRALPEMWTKQKNSAKFVGQLTSSQQWRIRLFASG